MSDGLADHERSMIQQVLAGVPALETAVLYGSRALGTFRPGSDIDLAVTGVALTDEDLARLAGQLDELPLPYRYDLTNANLISNPALRAHIENHGISFWRRNSALAGIVETAPR